MGKIKLENLVIPAFCGLIATGVAAGINEKEAREGIEAVQTYLTVPIGVTIGYIWDKLIEKYDKFMERKGFKDYGGCPKP